MKFLEGKHQMKRNFKSILGVTLLEIMLVLAIAAMIIVMSIRYYQSATNNQQANTVLEAIQAITAAADTLAQATGSYVQSNVSSSTIGSIVPTNTMTTPWGTAMTVTSATGTTYVVTLSQTPKTVCQLLNARLAANNHYSGVTANACDATADYTYTYISNP